MESYTTTMQLMHSGWFVARKRQTSAELRVMCFTHAGSGPSIYRLWNDYFGSNVEVLIVALPGREHRMREPCASDISEITTNVVEKYIDAMDDTPLMLFGHSMGAILAYDTCVRLEYEGIMVAALAVSGRLPPHIRHGGDFHRLPEAKFIDKLKKFNSLQQVILDDDGMRNLFIPILRSDYKLLECYPFNDTKVHAPVIICNGENDPETNESDMKRWRHLSYGDSRFRTFPGDHFYTKTQGENIAKFILSSLEEIQIVESVALK